MGFPKICSLSTTSEWGEGEGEGAGDRPVAPTMALVRTLTLPSPIGMGEGVVSEVQVDFLTRNS